MNEQESKLQELMKKGKAVIGQPEEEVDIYKDLRDQMQENADYIAASKMEEDETEVAMRRYMEDYENGDEEFDISDGEELAYENGPVISMVNAWKKQYGEKNVLHVKVVSKDFVIRTLNRLEYKSIISLNGTDPLIREELICKACVLYPVFSYKEMATQEAGYPSSLSQIIMQVSGFSNDYQIEVL